MRPRPRIEQLLVAQLALRLAHDGARLHEVERAIDELEEGWPNAHTEAVEAWCRSYLGGGA